MNRHRAARLSLTLVLGALVALPLAAGTVRGRVDATPDVHPRQPERYYLGPYRSGRGSEEVAEGGPTDVVVWVVGAPAPPGRGIPEEPPAIVQKNERFEPHVLPVRVGTTVIFPNEDDFYHNVFSVMAGQRFDLGRYGEGKQGRQTFTRPAVVVVRCEIHTPMKAYIVVLDSAYFTKPDVDGTYAISDVPAGSYIVRAWHPSRGERSRQIVVPADGEVTVDWSF